MSRRDAALNVFAGLEKRLKEAWQGKPRAPEPEPYIPREPSSQRRREAEASPAPHPQPKDGTSSGRDATGVPRAAPAPQTSPVMPKAAPTASHTKEEQAEILRQTSVFMAEYMDNPSLQGLSGKAYVDAIEAMLKAATAAGAEQSKRLEAMEEAARRVEQARRGGPEAVPNEGSATDAPTPGAKPRTAGTPNAASDAPGTPTGAATTGPTAPTVAKNGPVDEGRERRPGRENAASTPATPTPKGADITKPKATQGISQGQADGPTGAIDAKVPTEDEALEAARKRRRKALLAKRARDRGRGM